MKCFGRVACVCLIWMSITVLPFRVEAAESYPHPSTYMPTIWEVEKVKALFDDPGTFVGSQYDPRNVLPPALKAKFFFDVNEMKDLWAEIVGFRSPEIVGKIAPEIKPGKYTYQDLAKNPGLKELMIPSIYEMIKAGEPPYAGSIPQFTIVPTRQRYWALPVGKATKENAGKTKLDETGYIIDETWIAGYPFPRPSGKFKPQHYVYNIVKRYDNYGYNLAALNPSAGVDRGLKIDQVMKADARGLRLSGRVFVEPYGWFDERAKERGEHQAYAGFILEPRDLYGMVFGQLIFRDPEKQNQTLNYVPSLRRFKKLSATDSQDPSMGMDHISDDSYFFNQKVDPNRYPYDYEILEEREFLVPISYDGTEYYDSNKNFELRNVAMERRPIVVLLMKQKDPNYVYGKRVFYLDRETFQIMYVMNYNQKGVLYRSALGLWYFDPEMGMPNSFTATFLYRDHIDHHSTIGYGYNLPAVLERKDVNMQAMSKWGK